MRGNPEVNNQDSPLFSKTDFPQLSLKKEKGVQKKIVLKFYCTQKIIIKLSHSLFYPNNFSFIVEKGA